MGLYRYFYLSWLLVVLVGSYLTSAAHGMKYDYIGDNTEDEDLVCKNGGVVKLIDGKRKCSCFDQYFSGPFCEAPRGYCMAGLCLNGGTCNDYPGGYICSCTRGFYGKRCTHRSKTAPSASNPRLLIPILEVTSNSTSMFLVMDQLPTNETLFLELNTGDSKNIEYVLPRDNDKFVKYIEGDIEDGSKTRFRRGDLKGVSPSSYVSSVQVGAPREGRNTVALTARLANQRDHFAHAYSYYRRSVAKYMKYEYYGCSPNKTSPYAVFTGFGTTMAFSVSIDIAPRYTVFPKVRFAWSLKKVFGCRQETAQKRTCYANPNYARGEYNFANFKGKRRERDFARTENFVVLRPFDEYMQYDVNDHVTIAAFVVRAFDASGKEYSAYHNLICWVEFDDEFYVPWPPYASAHASNRSGLTFFSTRNVIHPYLPLYRQPRSVSNVDKDQDMGSKFTAQRGALMRCGGNVIMANALFKPDATRAYDCPPSDLSKCFCRMLISRDILFNQTEYYYTSYYFLPGVLTSGHYVYMTYFPNFRIPAMELRMKNNYHRFANPHLPIDVEVSCVLPEMGEDFELCSRYRRRVWWQVSPPLPIATDRMDVIVSSYRGKAVIGETYHFRSRARWSSEQMYDLSMRVTIEPNIYDFPTCVLSVLEISYYEWKAAMFSRKTPLYFRLVCGPLPQKYAVVPYMEEDNQFQFGLPHLYKIYGGEPDLHGMVLLRFYRSYYKVGQRSRTLRDGLLLNNFFHRPDGSVPLLFVVQGVYGTYTRKRYVLKVAGMCDTGCVHEVVDLIQTYIFLSVDKFPEPQRRQQTFTIEALYQRIDYYLSIYSPTAVSAIACLAYEINIIGPYDSSKEKLILKYLEYVHKLPLPDATGVEQIHSLMTLMKHYIVRSNKGNYTYNLELGYLQGYERLASQLKNMTTKSEKLDFEHIGDIATSAFEDMQEILFRDCKEHFCDKNKVIVSGRSASAGVQNYPELKADVLDEDQHLALSNTWLSTIEQLFQSMSTHLNAGQQPFMWVDNRKLLIASFHNLSPMTRNAFIRDIYFFARGFAARVAIGNYTLNIVTGMVLMQHNFHFDVDAQMIDTPVVILRFYNEPSDNAVRNFENITARYRPYPPGSAKMIASLTVDTPYDTTAWTASKTDPDGIIYYRILVDTSIDMQIVFHPTKEYDDFQIAMSQMTHPSEDEDRIRINNKGLRFILPKVPDSGPFLYLLVTSELDPVFYNFSVYSIECFDWQIEKWEHVCEAMEDTWRVETWTPKTISCKCTRLNLELAAQIYSPAILREYVFKRVEFGAILFNNTMGVTYEDWYPVVYIVGILILGFLLLNCILLLWCPPKMLLRKNLEAAPERVGDFMKAIYFQDNCASWTYTYLVGVETDWRYRAGTTSNVCLQVYGRDGKSMAHLLRDGYKRVIFPGTCTYFLMKTEKSLGQLLYIKLWIDMTGEFPGWFCARVHICEILMNDIWIFNVNRWFKLGHGNNCLGKIVSQPRYVQPQPAYVIVANFHRCVQRDHPLACLFISQPRSTFTRSQRVMVLIATMSVQAAACAAFVGLPFPTPMSLIRESSVNLADKLAIIAIMVAFFAVAANYVMSYFFRNVVRKKKEAEDWDQEIIECGMPFSNQYFKLGGSAAGYNYLPRAGGLIACIGWELCPSPRGVGAKQLDCAGNDPPPPAKLLQLYSTIGTYWLVHELYEFGGWVGAIWIGMHFNEDRAWEFTCCFVGSVFIHVACMEPMKALLVAAVAGFRMEDSPRDMGNLDTIVLSDIYKAEHIDIDQGMKISKNIRKLDPVYRVMTTKQEELRAVGERNVGSASGASIWYVVWSIMVLTTMMAICGSLRLHTSYYSWKATEDLFFNAKWGGFPASKIDSFVDLYDFLNSTIVESVHPLPEPLETMPWMVDGTNKMIGVGRLRQVQAPDVLCRERTITALDSFNRTCGIASMPDKPKRRFGLADLDFSLVSLARAPMVYQTSDQAESLSYKGLQRHFEGNGFIAVLGRNRHNTIVLLNYLKEKNWLDNRTSAVFYEITIYSNDASTFSYAMVLFERSPVGLYLVSNKIWAARLFSATPEESRSTALLFAGAVIMLFLSTCYLIAVDSQQTFAELSSDKWHFVDISAVVLAMIAAVVLVLRSVFCDVLKEDLDRYTSRRFVSTHGAMIMDEWAAVFLGAVVFCCIIRLCKHFIFHDSFRVMGRAVIHATGDIVSYSIGLFFCSTAVSASFHLLLWRHFTEYSTLKQSIVTTLTPRDPAIDNAFPFINGGALTIMLGIAAIILIVCYLGSGLVIFMVLSFARIQRRPTGLAERTKRRHKQLYWLERFSPKKPSKEAPPA